ncbi:hypothetical protein [Pseudomonas donghuensis]|uniref:hypothetical protein n=1 Tax=Pseudomonas donghuensis TaxID=1163398 RepID=UPI002E112FE6|nr:hypothetical protein VP780_10600 [Pseudomonas donghuensis]
MSYGYDNAGQRVQLGGSLACTTLPGAVSATSYNAANQLTAWSDATLLYDANGNMTSDDSNTYTWDSRQRLITLTGSTSGSFSYDAVNRRSQKTISGQTTGYVFDGVNLVQELTGAVPPRCRPTSSPAASTKYSAAPKPVAAPTATWLMRWVQPIRSLTAAERSLPSTPMILMARPAAAALSVLTVSSTPGGKMMVRV